MKTSLTIAIFWLSAELHWLTHPQRSRPNQKG